MLTPSRSLSLNADAGRELPRIEELEALYRMGVKFRHGQIMMIAGRSGTQKSGFALWLAAQWNVPTLYFSADMSAFTASSRLACMATGDRTERVESGMAKGGAHRAYYLDALDRFKFTFSFGAPITWHGVEAELDAYIELWDAFPELIIFDNLMDFDGAESDYTAQMETMAEATELARNTGASTMLLHHATDKGWNAEQDPWSPPSRGQIKGGLSEKPELTLAVGLDPHSMAYKVACLKQRMGPSDPTGQTCATLRCYPEVTRFGKFEFEPERLVTL